MIVTPKQIEKENPIKIIVTNYIKLHTFIWWSDWGLHRTVQFLGLGHEDTRNWLRIVEMRRTTRPCEMSHEDPHSSNGHFTSLNHQDSCSSIIPCWNARRVSQTTLYSTIGGLIPEAIGEGNSENSSTLMLKMLKAGLFCPANLPIAILQPPLARSRRLQAHAEAEHGADLDGGADRLAHDRRICQFVPLTWLIVTDSHYRLY